MNGLLFVRHAQTDFAGRFCGHCDPPINMAGRKQVNDLVQRLSAESIDAIYSSDLRRAVNTAELLAESLAVPVSTTPCLREIHFGDWEGLTWTEIEQRDAACALRWLEEFPALAAPGGETFAAFESRVLGQFAYLRSLAEERRIVVVTHGGVMRVVLRTLFGCSEQEAWQRTEPYCCTFECFSEARFQKVVL